jgi:AraC-like DNA-binding protein
MTSVYSSETLPGNKRQAWRELIVQLYSSQELDIAENFCGRIRRSDLGDLELTELSAAYESARRTNRHIASDKHEFFLFNLVRQGRVNYSQFNRECVLGPGCFTLIDLNWPYTYRNDEQTDSLLVKIPSLMFRSRISHADRLCAVPRKIDAGIGQVTADFLNSLAVRASRIPEETALSLAGRVVDLLSVLFESAGEGLPISDCALRRALYRKCTAFIDNHLADPDLDPAAIAGAIGISVRHLHRVFSDSGESVCEYLMERRLRRCREDLDDIRKSGLSIMEIASRNGFRSQPHFTNAFRERFGLPPGEARRQSLGSRAA